MKKQNKEMQELKTILQDSIKSLEQCLEEDATDYLRGRLGAFYDILYILEEDEK